MPITIQCSGCGKTLTAPDTAAGKKAKCPQCGAITRLPGPETAAAPVGGSDPLADALAAQASSPPTAGGGYDLAAPAAAPGTGEDRRPCPMCGEMIPAQAMKCRFCGHVFDPRLNAAGAAAAGVSSGPIPNYLVQSILVTLFCCLIFGIIAIVHAAQVNTKVAAGDHAGAQEASRKAKMWCWLAFGLGLPIQILVVVLQIVAAAMQH
jgi:predicted RNA-binding Zn-ribbon protein involved in translation (DUF1610 family)